MTTPLGIRSELRRRLHDGAQRTYCLVELDGSSSPAREPFLAPSDDEALDRALDVAEGEVFELWEGDRLVRRWTPSEENNRSFSPR